MDVLPTGRGDSVGQEQTIEQPEADNQCAGLRHLPLGATATNR